MSDNSVELHSESYLEPRGMLEHAGKTPHALLLSQKRSILNQKGF